MQFSKSCFYFLLSTFVLLNTTIVAMNRRLLNRTNSIQDLKKIRIVALHEAAKNGDLKALEEYLRTGIYVDAQDREGNSALHHATSTCDVDEITVIKVIKRLLLHGANIHLKNGKDQTPYNFISLSKASKIKHNIPLFLLIQDLIKENVHVVNHSIYYMKKGTPLHKAILSKSKDLELVQRLLELNAPLEAKDEFGNTPLHTALKVNDLTLIVALVQTGANIYLPNSNNISPFQQAASSGDTVLAHILYQQYMDLWHPVAPPH